MANIKSGVSGMQAGAAIGSIVPGIGTVIGGAIGGLAGLLFGDDDDAGAEAQYEYDMAKYGIEKEYYADRLLYQGELSSYGDAQLSFAYEQKAYAQHVYNTAVYNAQQAQAFKEKEVYNKKLAAKTEYNAQLDVAKIMQDGAQDSLNNTIQESLRTGKANIRELHRKTAKAQGDTVAAISSGITGGASRDRILIATHMEGNRQKALIKDQVGSKMIQATQAKDKLVSDYTLKINEGYRNLAAVLRLEASPMPAIAGPQPVFTVKAPIAPIAPLGPEPISGAYSSGGFNSIASGLSAGVDIYNWADSSSGVTTPNYASDNGWLY